MASLNLSSFAALWQSMKSFFLSNFATRTVLFSSNTSETGNIQLSESLNNFKYFSIKYTTNDQREILVDYFAVDSLTDLLTLGFPQAGTTSNNAIYVKYASITVSSDRTTLTRTSNVEIRLKVSDNSVRNTEFVGIRIINISGYDRIN